MAASGHLLCSASPVPVGVQAALRQRRIGDRRDALQRDGHAAYAARAGWRRYLRRARVGSNQPLRYPYLTSTQQKVIKNKLGLLKLAETLGSVSQALQEVSRRKPIPKNRVEPHMEPAYRGGSCDAGHRTAYGQVRQERHFHFSGPEFVACGCASKIED
jgi:hypothetical protein